MILVGLRVVFLIARDHRQARAQAADEPARRLALEVEAAVRRVVAEHIDVLGPKLARALGRNEYGTIDVGPSWQAEVEYFEAHVLLPDPGLRAIFAGAPPALRGPYEQQIVARGILRTAIAEAILKDPELRRRAGIAGPPPPPGSSPPPPRLVSSR